MLPPWLTELASVPDLETCREYNALIVARCASETRLNDLSITCHSRISKNRTRLHIIDKFRTAVCYANLHFCCSQNLDVLRFFALAEICARDPSIARYFLEQQVQAH